VIGDSLARFRYLDSAAKFSYFSPVIFRDTHVPPTVLVRILVLSSFLGYLIGSIPTAFLLVRWKSNVDIRQVGSGNVGALNSLLVTGSKLVGGLVLLIDLAKGGAAVLLASTLFGAFDAEAAAGASAIVGHNYPLWLGWKGGRGLATAAGVMLIISWPVVGIWGGLWVLGFGLTKDVNVGSAIASAGGLLGSVFVPDALLAELAETPAEFRIFLVILFVLILMKLMAPVRQYFAASGTTRG
jgi:glycerol-3-phosphate acyltransferase PlsY